MSNETMMLSIFRRIKLQNQMFKVPPTPEGKTRMAEEWLKSLNPVIEFVLPAYENWCKTDQGRKKSGIPSCTDLYWATIEYRNQLEIEQKNAEIASITIDDLEPYILPAPLSEEEQKKNEQYQIKLLQTLEADFTEAKAYRARKEIPNHFDRSKDN